MTLIRSLKYICDLLKVIQDLNDLSIELGYHPNPYILDYWTPDSKNKFFSPENHLSLAAMWYNSTTFKKQSEDKTQTKLDLTT